MLYPSLEEVKGIAAQGEYKRIPVRAEMYADMVTPMQAVRILKNRTRHVFLLESAEETKQWGRYTFLGYDPVLEVSCRNHVLKIRGNGECVKENGRPQEVLRRILAENRAPRLAGMPPFTGGLVGYFSYDYIKYSEPTLKLEAGDRESFQDMDVMLFERVIAFDNYRQKIFLIENLPAAEAETAYRKAEAELEELKNLLLSREYGETEPLRLTTEFQELFGREAYCEMVERAKHYIHEGDIFQVVLSNRLKAEKTGSLLDVYRVLRTENPSPYMFYFAGDDLEIAGASPETLAKLEDGVLRTFPLAGTRPRGRTEEEDRRMAKELLEDEKERAEHNMLVDLGRNDVGKISRIGSVEMEKYMDIEKYSHVMHIGSVVKGILREDRDAVDVVDAILPAGTLSGAPKLRACQIIDRLEDNKRGIYGGAIGYLDFTGNMDTCIAIRIVYARDGKLFIRSGAGIVADSVPEKEYQECVNKAKAMVEAVEKAKGGIAG